MHICIRKRHAVECGQGEVRTWVNQCPCSVKVMWKVLGCCEVCVVESVGVRVEVTILP